MIAPRCACVASIQIEMMDKPRRLNPFDIQSRRPRAKSATPRRIGHSRPRGAARSSGNLGTHRGPKSPTFTSMLHVMLRGVNRAPLRKAVQRRAKRAAVAKRKCRF